MVLLTRPPASPPPATGDAQPPEAPLHLVLPRAGRYTVTCEWEGLPFRTVESTVYEGEVVLPECAGGDVLLQAAAKGEFTGEGVRPEPVVAAPGDAASAVYRLLGPAARRTLRWFPGRRSGGEQEVVGAAQTVVISTNADRELGFTCTINFSLRHGEFPDDAELALPAGWLVHQLPEDLLTQVGPGRFRIRGGPETLTLQGILTADADIDLPRIQGMHYAGGEVRLDLGADWNWTVPGPWWITGVNRYQVSAAGHPLRVYRPTGAARVRLHGIARLTLGAERCGLDLIYRMSADQDLFALDLDAIPGWRPVEFRFTGEAPPQVEFTEVAGRLRLRFPAGLRAAGQPVHLQARFEPVGEIAPALAALTLPAVPGTERLAYDLSIAVEPGLRLELGPMDRWRSVPPGPSSTASGIRVQMQCLGAPPPLAIAVAPQEPVAMVDAVCWLVPAPAERRDESWLRCDLRLRIVDGEVGELLLDLPFAGVEGVRHDETVAKLEREVAGFRLRFHRAFVGERTLRFEGIPAAESITNLPRIGVSLPRGGRIEQRQWLALQIDDAFDLDLPETAALQPIDSDELPAWSRAIPGLPVSRAWRLAGVGDPGGYALRRPELATLPAGFIDDLRITTQVADHGSVTVVRCVVAAPGMQSLDLGLPAGARLLRAQVDGHDADVRRQGTSLLLPLPGRTQCAVALRYDLPATPAAVGWDYRQAPPALAGLPVVRCRWELAVADNWQVTVVEDADSIRLDPYPGQMPADRRPFHPWTDACPAPAGLPTQVASAPAGGTDPRRLAAAQAADPAAAAIPDPTLVGFRFTGAATGAAELRLVLRRTAALQLLDRWGAVLGFLLALAAAWRLRRTARLVTIAGAALLATTINGDGWVLLLGAAEAYVAAGVVFLTIGVLRRLRPRRVPPGAIVAGLLLTAMLPVAGFGGEAVLASYGGLDEQPDHLVWQRKWTAVLASYGGLDEQGRPIDVRVALTRQQLTELQRLSMTPVPAGEPAVDFATGLPVVLLEEREETLVGTLSLPVAVFVKEWRTCVLPMADARLDRVELVLPDGSREEAPTTPGPPGLAVHLRPGQLAVLRCQLALPRGKALPVPGGNGGEILARLAAGRELWVGDRKADPPPDAGGLWRTLLPASGKVAVTVKDAPKVADQRQRELALGLQQTVALELAGDRIEWSVKLEVRARAGRFRALRLDLPAGLLVHDVSAKGLAGWRQEERVLRLDYPEDLGKTTLELRGIIQLTTTDPDVLVGVPGGTEQSSGRLAIADSRWGRLRPLAETALQRDTPRAGERLAYLWNEQPAELRVAVRLADRDLRARQENAVWVADDQLVAVVHLDLAGKGTVDRLRFAASAPWVLDEDASPGARLVTVGDGREIAFRQPDAVLAEGSTVRLVLRADLADLAAGADVTLPDCLPLDGSVVMEKRAWLIGDGGRLELDLRDPAQADPAAYKLLERRCHEIALPPGIVWRHAAAVRGAEVLRLVRRPLEGRFDAVAGHYLVMAEDRLHWSSRLMLTPSRGALAGIGLRLPPGVILRRLQASNLAGHAIADGRIEIRLATPTRDPVAIALELELPFGPAVTVAPYELMPSPGTQLEQLRHFVSLVEDEIAPISISVKSLTGITPQTPLPLRREFAANLPEHIDRERLRHCWSADVPWELSLARIAARLGTGPDGIITLVDAGVVLAPDGELRGRATWHLVNRTRQQLDLELGDGIEVWQTRVGGRAVRLRRTAHGLAVPVPPLRPGQASTMVELTWSQAPAAGEITIRLPRFAGLSVNRCLLKVVPPPGFTLTRRDGTLLAAAEELAVRHRSQRVVDELGRLRQQGDDLADAGLERLHANLALLEQELHDYTGQVQVLQRRQAVDESILSLTAKNAAEVQRWQGEVQQIQQGRQHRARALNSGGNHQAWSLATAPATAPGTPLLKNPDWWRDNAVERGERLPGGEPPPGLIARHDVQLLGIELLGDPDRPGVLFEGDAKDLFVVVDLQREAAARWWLRLTLGLGSALVIILGLVAGLPWAAWRAARRARRDALFS
jgi:hypothetical protein